MSDTDSVIQDMFISLLLPLLFSLTGSAYLIHTQPDRTQQALLIMVLFQLVGGLASLTSATPELFALLCFHALITTTFMLRHLTGAAHITHRS